MDSVTLNPDDIVKIIGVIGTIGSAILTAAIAGWRTLQKVLKEMTPNSGSSMKDQMTKVEQTVSGMDSRIITLEARQRLLNDRGNDLVVEFDTHGRVTHVNRNLVLASGRIENEFMGSGWLNIVELADRNRCGEEWAEAFEEKRAYETEANLRLLSGAGRYQLRISPVIGAGAILGWFGQFTAMEPVSGSPSPSSSPRGKSGTV